MDGRTKKAFLNVEINFFIQIIKTIFAFVTRTIFIYYLGKKALGLNGLFTNVLSMLSLAELGIGTAINFSLYDPLAKKDNKKVSSLMSFYKRAYRIVGVIVAILGLALIPFLHYLIKDIESVRNVYLIYLLFLINSVSSYFISYKETLINADQKNYKLAKINILFLIILNLCQILIILLYQNFIYYLIVQIIIQLLQKIVINIYITKQYNNVDFLSKNKINNNDMKIIKKNVKAMFFHKIGDYCINGTDNLIISSFIGIEIVGLYSNYQTLIALLTTFITLFFSSITPSVGNLIVNKSKVKNYDVFKKLNFAGFVLYGFFSILLFNTVNDIISLWIGEDYCMNFDIIIAIIINFYITGQRVAPHTMKSAAGLYDIDKFTPIIQSVINLIISIVLVKYVGLFGIILGTIISGLILPSWQRPYIIYKYIFNEPFKKYIINYIRNSIFLICIAFITFYVNQRIIFSSKIITLIIKCIVTSFIYCAMSIFLYGNTKEFKYFSNYVKKIFRSKIWKKG